MDGAAWILGLHLLTGHTHSTPDTFTPGIYVVTPIGLTGGIARNSYGDPIAYAAWTWQTEGRLSVGLTAGGIVGYKAEAVRPMLIPSVRLGLGESAGMRLSYLPRSPEHGYSDALSLSLEWTYK